MVTCYSMWGLMLMRELMLKRDHPAPRRKEVNEIAQTLRTGCREFPGGGVEPTRTTTMGHSEEAQVRNTEEAIPTVGGIPRGMQDVADEIVRESLHKLNVPQEAPDGHTMSSIMQEAPADIQSCDARSAISEDITIERCQYSLVVMKGGNDSVVIIEQDMDVSNPARDTTKVAATAWPSRSAAECGSVMRPRSAPLTQVRPMKYEVYM
ncbi:hypothetical protein Cgig2_023444 [Carnegiea gigantea]|uniref:Uncharacterized protein n=1 Tax=Carnegiea gigantea TaxID=171969 RepID=A0A9Q1JGS6_9CARY|nr:hypothetical protein Cgig2_023444 [Carnegiea gigantea]